MFYCYLIRNTQGIFQDFSVFTFIYLLAVLTYLFLPIFKIHGFV